jgi:uncharacterized protein (TIGR00730 family)
VANERRYQLQSEEANRQIEALLKSVGGEGNGFYAQMLTSVLKMAEDNACVGDLKIANSALKDLRYAFKVFSAYRGIPKVTIFGSARSTPDDPISVQARAFTRRLVDAGWMVITGAGPGVMGAAQEGAGREQSFGLNIRLPWEQEANPWIADDPKLINYKFFFIRKLFLVKEADAVVFFPGGFGTMDEVFEVLTLVQTGKTPLVPVVLLDVAGGDYWRRWEQVVRENLAGRDLISPEDLHLFRVTDSVEDAVQEVLGFYRCYHSMRFVGDQLVIRLKREIPPEMFQTIGREFGDILTAKCSLAMGPLQAEGEEEPTLWRLVLPFDRMHYGRLRQLIDFINKSA